MEAYIRWQSVHKIVGQAHMILLTQVHVTSLSPILKNESDLVMTKFKQLVRMCEGRKSCDTGMRRYYHGKRKVYYQGGPC